MRALTPEEIKTLSLDILQTVHNFCVREGIHYSLAYGTLIGAIRHKGFIPWDDDVDIMMPRPDYERFCSIFQSDGLGIVSEYNPDCYINFCRIFDVERTSTVTAHNFMKNYCGGVWIDIFPIDGVEDDFKAFSSRYRKLRRLWLFQITMRSALSPLSAERSFLAKLKGVVKKIVTFNGLPLPMVLAKMRKLDREVSFGKTGHCSQLACLDSDTRRFHHIEDFQEWTMLEFEGRQFCSIKGYDRFLRDNYRDYMQLPPEDQRVYKHAFNEFYWKEI